MTNFTIRQTRNLGRYFPDFPNSLDILYEIFKLKEENLKIKTIKNKFDFKIEQSKLNEILEDLAEKGHIQIEKEKIIFLED